uniref:Uncharacterized protein n=1 Tax=Sus scrofa TaxID=9823 RepID=A0A8D1SUR3_PIG
MLILYPATLLNLLISLSSFCMESIGFSIYSIMSSSYSDTFTTSLPIWIPFICFVCLIAVVRTSNTMLNKRVMRMGILVLFQIFFFFFFRATHTAHGGSQARDRIRGTVASLCHNHSNSESKLHLQPTPQLMATPDP